MVTWRLATLSSFFHFYFSYFFIEDRIFMYVLMQIWVWVREHLRVIFGVGVGYFWVLRKGSVDYRAPLPFSLKRSYSSSFMPWDPKTWHNSIRYIDNPGLILIEPIVINLQKIPKYSLPRRTLIRPTILLSHNNTADNRRGGNNRRRLTFPR